MRIIFLDIDGVLNFGNVHQHCQNFPTEYIRYPVRPGNLINVVLLQALRNFCACHNIKIVAISSWVTNPTNLLQVTNFLQLPIVDMIDYTGGGTHRAKSVVEYLYKNEITNYCIVDDAYHWYDSFPTLIPHVVPINGAVGIEPESLSLIYTILIKDQ